MREPIHARPLGAVRRAAYWLRDVPLVAALSGHRTVRTTTAHHRAQAAVILAAQAMGQGAVTDGLACALLGLRVAQSTVHIIAVNHWMVFLRATLWTGQTAILIYWMLKLAGVV